MSVEADAIWIYYWHFNATHIPKSYVTQRIRSIITSINYIVYLLELRFVPTLWHPAADPILSIVRLLFNQIIKFCIIFVYHTLSPPFIFNPLCILIEWMFVIISDKIVVSPCRRNANSIFHNNNTYSVVLPSTFWRKSPNGCQTLPNCVPFRVTQCVLFEYSWQRNGCCTSALAAG